MVVMGVRMEKENLQDASTGYASLGTSVSGKTS